MNNLSEEIERDIEYECPNCREWNDVGSDWQCCLHQCESCGSESSVSLMVESVTLKIKRDAAKQVAEEQSEILKKLAES